jgi:AraC-like DNA-binding protein
MELANRIIVLDRELPACVVEAVALSPVDRTVEAKSFLSAQWVLVHISQGDGWLQGPGYSAQVRTDTLLSLPPGRHDFYLPEPHKFTILSLHEPPAQAGARAGFTFPLMRSLSRFESHYWRRKIEETAHVALTRGLPHEQIAALRLELFAQVWLPVRRNNREAVVAAIETMWGRVARPMRLDDVAGDLGYTTNYLNDLTRLHTGRSLGRWLNDMRMIVARSLLVHGDAPIAEVAAACGFEDPAYFSRAFRRFHSVAPATWRIAHRPEDARHSEIVIPFDQIKRMESRMAVSV